MQSPIQAAVLQLRAVRRATRDRRPSLGGVVRPLDERTVFVFGSPRSGTTFLAGAIGSCTGFVDLGEVATLKAAIPSLAQVDPLTAGARIRRIVDRTRRLAALGGLRAVEQTPEVAFVIASVSRAFPEATLVHIVRDGRDVVCSLLERGWLNAGRRGGDDAGLEYGAHARFWVEPERQEEFAAASDARRAAWAWRRYVTAAHASGDRIVDVRYEDLFADPGAVAATLAARLVAQRTELERALATAHGSSIGRFRQELTDEQLADVEEEAGAELRALGYLQ